MNYQMDLVGEDIDLVVSAVNQGIDAYLQAITQSEFEFYKSKFGTRRLRCTLKGKDIGVLIRRLLESEDEYAYDLAQDMAGTLGYEYVSLTFDDRFIFEGIDPETDEDFDEFVSVFDEDFWERELKRA